MGHFLEVLNLTRLFLTSYNMLTSFGFSLLIQVCSLDFSKTMGSSVTSGWSWSLRQRDDKDEGRDRIQELSKLIWSDELICELHAYNILGWRGGHGRDRWRDAQM